MQAETAARVHERAGHPARLDPQDALARVERILNCGTVGHMAAHDIKRACGPQPATAVLTAFYSAKQARIAKKLDLPAQPGRMLEGSRWVRGSWPSISAPRAAAR